jgi:hypothetical protein
MVSMKSLSLSKMSAVGSVTSPCTKRGILTSCIVCTVDTVKLVRSIRLTRLNETGQHTFKLRAAKVVCVREEKEDK